MISSGIFRVQLDVEDVDVGEAFEQDALAFHDGLAGQRADVAESEDGGAVGDDRDQVALGGVLESVLWVLLDFEAGHGHAGRVGEAEISLGAARLGRDDLDFAGP